MKYILPLLLIISTAHAQLKIPARFEAEAYSSSRSTELNTDTSADNLGGKYLTFKSGAWTSYYINVLTAGTYMVNLRVGDGSGGAVNQIRKSDGTIWASYTTPATGGLNVWKTISCKIILSAGKQTFRIVDVSGEYNMNWLEIVPYTDSAKPTPSGGVSQADFNALKGNFNSLRFTLDSLKHVIDTSYIRLDARVFKEMPDGTTTIPKLLPAASIK